MMHYALKPVKRGYKVWVRVDYKIGYIYKVDIYTGKNADNVVTTGL